MSTRIRFGLGLSALSVLILVLDIFASPYLLFPILFVIPVGVGAWYLGRTAGIAYAVALVGSRFIIAAALSEELMPVWAAALNAGIRMLVLFGLAVLVAKLAEQKRMLEERVRVLEGILPICSFCKKIRQPDGSWEQIEAYVSEHSEAKFSHGFCEECGRKHYGVELPSYRGVGKD